MLIAYIDFKSPGSLLAIDPTITLAERCGIAIDWRPFSATERDLPDSGADRAVIASHHRVRLQSRRGTDTFYASLRGIELRYPQEDGSTELALGALAQVEGDRLPFIRAAFSAYWEHHSDLDDPEVVAELLATSEAGHTGDLSTTRAAFAAAQAEAEAAGVVDAPGFVIAGQLFIGRQHMPWIEELARS
jgi:2-hydroxychromene-2-carboxylate isomerase